MRYVELCKLYECLEAEPSKLKKVELLVNFFKKVPSELLPKVVLLCLGRVSGYYEGLEFGIATKMVMKAIERALGVSKKYVEEKFREFGDLGLVAEHCASKRKQLIFLRKGLSVAQVFEELSKLPSFSGEGAQERRIDTVAELLNLAEPLEARYLVRTLLQELRIGVAEGMIRDAIAQVAGVNAELVEQAWNLWPHYGEIARIALTQGEEGLKQVKLEIGRPIMVMLGEKAESLEEALNAFEHCILEYKYDGARIVIHKRKDCIWLFTRRLEDVTAQFPELVERAKLCLKPEECVVEGEAIAVDPKTRNPLPFQMLSQRIQRKYEVKRMEKEVPVRMYLFDMLYLNGQSLLDKPLAERRRLLEQWVNPIRQEFELSHALVTKNLEEAKQFLDAALAAKQEGLMVKNLDAAYMPGRRVGYMLKVKTTMEPLDLVIVGAEWGTGKRARWLSSFVLGCRDPESGKFLECGMMGTGFTEEQLEEMTQKLKPLIVEQSGRVVKLKPRVVVEVAYEEIQESPHYESGFALRFPRFLRERTAEKPPEQADTLERIKHLFELQARRRHLKAMVN